MSENQKIPGEKIVSIEEYLSGENTYEDNDVIRATVIGDIIIGVVDANLP